MRQIFYLTLFLSFIFIGCKKDKLTPETKIGANTFSCKINGKVFKPFYEGGLFNNNPVLGVRNNRQYDFIAYAVNQESKEGIYLENPFIKAEGTYLLKVNSPNRGIYELDIAGASGSGFYTTDNLHSGVLTITRCDTINKIYSGTFYFTAINASTGQVINVTDGRFDLKE